jgi:hypothetical protein
MGRFEDRLQERLYGTQLALRSAIIVSTYYGNTDALTAFADIVIQDQEGKAQTYSKVPIAKVGGVSQTLPPVGSNALIGFVDNNSSKPFVLGCYDSEITKRFVEDNKRPRKPPTSLTR